MSRLWLHVSQCVVACPSSGPCRTHRTSACGLTKGQVHLRAAAPAVSSAPGRPCGSGEPVSRTPGAWAHGFSPSDTPAPPGTLSGVGLGWVLTLWALRLRAERQRAPAAPRQGCLRQSEENARTSLTWRLYVKTPEKNPPLPIPKAHLPSMLTPRLSLSPHATPMNHRPKAAGAVVTSGFEVPGPQGRVPEDRWGGPLSAHRALLYGWDTKTSASHSPQVPADHRPPPFRSGSKSLLPRVRVCTWQVGVGGGTAALRPHPSFPSARASRPRCSLST